MDPMAEDYYSSAPYNYVDNNPIGYIDPTGMYKVDANGNITIEDKGEIEEFLKFLKNNNNNATYKDIATEVFSADNGYSNELEEVSIIGRTAYNNGTEARAIEASYAVGASAITRGFALGELFRGMAIDFGVSKATIATTGVAAIGVGLIYVAFKMHHAGIPVDSRSYVHSVLGLSTLEQQRVLMSKGGHRNIWPDQYGYPPNVKDINWEKSDGQLADDLSNAYGDSKRGQGSANNLARKWFRDKRPKK